MKKNDKTSVLLPSALALVFFALSFFHFATIPALTIHPQPTVSPDTIDFRKLRVGNLKVDSILIFNQSSSSISFKTTVNYQNYIHTGQFIVDSLPNKISLIIGANTLEIVRFHPVKQGIFRDTFLMTYYYPPLDSDSVRVTLFGRGINYLIPNTIFSFGKIRLGTTDTAIIPVTNFGDDTTLVSSVTLENTGDSRDFGILTDSLPLVKPWRLDTLGSGKNSKSFKAFFLPKYDLAGNIIDTGLRKAIIDITADDGKIFHDTLTGIGVEPLIIATDTIVDFGNIFDPPASSPTDTVLYDTLVNTGSMAGILDSLRLSDTTFFSIKTVALTAPVADNISIQEKKSLPFAVIFHIKQSGDFVDTIRASNDSRSKPVVILHAKVRSGLAPPNPITLGTISNCIPIDTEFIIHNPFKVNVKIDSFWIEGNTGGFDLKDLDTATGDLKFPVFIDADSNFTLHISYKFPVDSLNGVQIAKIIFKRPTGGSSLSIEYDTATISLTRKIILLNISAVQPAYNPSATDAPFRLPIHLQGQRLGKTELDNDTLKLVFSNKLIQPVGIDRTGSLTESTPANGIPMQPAPIWDEVHSTYNIPCVGLHISTDSSKNTLLCTLLCTAFLTNDTALDITPVIGYIEPPCAYRVSRDSTMLSYANECGDQTIREMLLTSVPIQVAGPIPNPVGNSQSIIYTFQAAKDMLLSWKLYDASGVMEDESAWQDIHSGAGTLRIPMKQTYTSGAHYLEVTVRDAHDGAQATVSSKFQVVK